MSLLILNTLPQEETAAEQTIKRLTAAVPEHRVIHTGDLRISPCIGCNACWLRTPGICGIKDDHEQILTAYLQYDHVVCLAGTALGFVDHRMKNLVDRSLPLVTMYMRFVDGQMRHIPRYEKKLSMGLLFLGAADPAYLNRWWDRVVLNLQGVSLGAYPISQWEEVLSCIS